MGVLLLLGGAQAAETAELLLGSTALQDCLDDAGCGTAARERIADALREAGVAAEHPALGTHAALATGHGFTFEIGAQSFALPPGSDALPPGRLFAAPVVPRVGLGWIAGEAESSVRMGFALHGAPPIPLEDDLAWAGGLLVSAAWGTPDGRGWVGLEADVGLANARGTLVDPTSLADDLGLQGAPTCPECQDVFSQVNGALGSTLRYDFDPTTPLFFGLGANYAVQTLSSGADDSTWAWRGLQPRARAGAGYRPAPAGLLGVVVQAGLKGPASVPRPRLVWTAAASVAWRFGPTLDEAPQGLSAIEPEPEPEPVAPEPALLELPVIERVDHPALSCGAKLIPTGAPPPLGTEAWCVRITETGQVQRHGDYLRWHDETRIAERGQYEADQRAGEWVALDLDGREIARGSYAAGARHGPWRTWYETGELESEGSYVRGKESGVWIYWSRDGVARTEGSYTNGRREGVWTDFGPDGEPTRERVYRSGRLLYSTNL